MTPLDKGWSILPERLYDTLRDGETARQSWRFDAEQINQPRHSMHRWATDDKVRRRFVYGVDFRADAAIGRFQAAIGQAGPIAANRLIETFGPLRIHTVINLIDPLDIRSETRLPPPGQASCAHRDPRLRARDR